MKEQIYIKHLENSFLLAEKRISKINDEIINMDGMSGEKTRHLYNNLLNIEDARYLEIGTWKGSTTCSAMFGNCANVLCIDNWSEFGGPKDVFLSNFEKYKGNNISNYIEEDCFKINLNQLNNYNIFMYDGEHSYESHFKALTYYYDVLDDIFIYIVDDWNWEPVRNATNKSFEHLNLNILWEKQIKLNDNNQTTHEKSTWWNGIAVFLLKKN